MLVLALLLGPDGFRTGICPSKASKCVLKFFIPVDAPSVWSTSIIRLLTESCSVEGDQLDIAD